MAKEDILELLHQHGDKPLSDIKGSWFKIAFPSYLRNAGIRLNSDTLKEFWKRLNESEANSINELIEDCADLVPDLLDLLDSINGGPVTEPGESDLLPECPNCMFTAEESFLTCPGCGEKL